MIQPTPKPAPTRDRSREAGILGEVHSDAVPIFVYGATLHQILDYSEEDRSRELGGFLVGGFHEDRRAYVEVRHFLPARDAPSRVASLTFTHETWSQLHREVEAGYPNDRVVGWHHTHPNLGVFLSAYDLFVHRHFFAERWQVALVVDPQRQEFGFFQWRGKTITDCGFVYIHREVLPAEESPYPPAPSRK